MVLLYGRAGTGKTWAVFDAARRYVREFDASRLWVIQPTRSAARAFAREVATGLDPAWRSGPRVAVGPQVHTFSSLCLQIHDMAGVPRPQLLPQSLRPVLVARALRDVCRNAPDFARLTRRIGYRRLLAGFIGETLRNRITPEQLLAAPAELRSRALGEDSSLARRVEMLGSLLDHYMQLCAQHGVIDMEELPSAATNLLDDRDYRDRIQQRVGLLLVDNFSRFTDSEAKLLIALARGARDATMVTLCCPKRRRDEADSLDEPPRAFAYLYRTREALRLFGDSQWTEQERPRQRRFTASSLAHLEQELFHADRRAFGGRELVEDPQRAARLKTAADELVRDRSIRVIEAPSLQAEVAAIAGEVRRLHSQEGMPLESIAVVHRASDPYDRMLRNAFDRAGVPILLPRRVRLADSPMWWLAQDLTKAALADPDQPFGGRALLANPLFDVDTTSRIRYEAARAGMFVQKEWLHAEDYQHDAARALVSEIRALVTRLRNMASEAPFPVTDFAAALRDGVERLAGRTVPEVLPTPGEPDAARQVRERVLLQRALHSTIESTAQMLADEGGAMPVETSEASTGSDAEADHFAAAYVFLEALTEAARLRQVRVELPGERVGVHAGDILHLRLPGELRVVFVAGLMQGTFPPPPSSDPVLPDRDRGRLKPFGLWYEERANLREHEDFQFYVACTRAASRLYLSWAGRDAGGKEVLPSLYVRDVAAAFGLDPDDLPRVDDRPEDRDDTRTPEERADAAWDEVEVARQTQVGGDIDRKLVRLHENPAVRLPWQDLHTPEELVRWVVRSIWQPREQDARTLAGWHAAAAVWDRWANTHDTLKMIASTGWSESDAKVARLGDAARAIIQGSDRALSASGINLFANCPFRFYSRYHLGLDEPDRAEPNAAAWGTLNHAVLEELGKHLRDGTMKAEPEPCADWAVGRLVELAGDPEQGFPRLLNQHRYRAELRQRTAQLHKFVQYDMRQRSRRGALPVAFEAAFGFADNENTDTGELRSEAPLTLTDDRGHVTVRIRGYIDLLEATDRLDRRGRRQAVVVDYKSGQVWKLAKRFKKFKDWRDLAAEMEPSDSYTGKDRGDPPDFQLPVYIMAARELFGFEPVAGFFYSIARRQRSGVWTDEAQDLASGDDLNRWDRQARHRFDEMINNARKALVGVARRLQDGEIAINPHDCMFCEFADLCRFDKKEEDMKRDRRRALSNLRAAESR